MATKTDTTTAKTEGRRKWVRYPGAIEHTGLSRTKLQAMVTGGKLPHVREGRIVLIDLDDLDRVLEGMKTTGIKA